MAREGVTYLKIEELYLFKAQSMETFSKAMDGILKPQKQTKRKTFVVVVVVFQKANKRLKLLSNVYQ